MRRIVLRNPDGTWDVRAPGAESASSRHPTLHDALDWARVLVIDAGGGEIEIRMSTGEVTREPVPRNTATDWAPPFVPN
jgi:hypothetical protein